MCVFLFAPVSKPFHYRKKDDITWTNFLPEEHAEKHGCIYNRVDVKPGPDQGESLVSLLLVWSESEVRSRCPCGNTRGVRPTLSSSRLFLAATRLVWVRTLEGGHGPRVSLLEPARR